ncbi:hypothetical protein PIB30_001326 [Stylosanthes scabra]|uniref:Uncharacterized protein n=1 Tax=Stylosanthes scabra TaxID=79078 RepID=A0ABU6Y4J2_9FABA|nr:hypothetical protein [Stylosanthes scabra]
MGRPKKSDAKHKEKPKQKEEESGSKNQGHVFRCLPTTVATMFDYLKEHLAKQKLVNQMGFDALSHLQNNNLDQVMLKQIYDRFDIHDNTIHSDAASVKITTRKIGDALGLCSTGTAYQPKVVRKKLSQEDKDMHKFWQGMTTVYLTEMVQTTPVDTEDNRKRFMRTFMLWIQKVFLLPNSTSTIVPNALTTIFDLETTAKRNWALHVQNFLIQELKKAKQTNSAAIHGCVYALMIIYFHETQFGENSKELEARKPWIAYWKGDTLKERLKQERTHEAGLIKTSEMMAKKDALKRKNPTMRVPPSKRNSDSESESYQPSPDSEATESDLPADAEQQHDSDAEQEADHGARDEPLPRREIRSKWKNDRPVLGSNEPVDVTQQSVAGPRTSPPDSTRLKDLVGKSKRRKSQRIISKSKKQKLSQINEGDEAIPSPSDTRMFDSFDTVSLGRDDSANIIVEGSVAVPSQPSQNEKEDVQPGHDHEARNDDQPEHDHHETEDAAGLDVEGAAIEVPHVMEDNVQEEDQPEPLVLIMPINPEDQTRMATQDLNEHTEPEPEPINIEMPLEHEDQPKIATEGPSEDTEPEKQTGDHTEVDPKAVSMEMPLEHEYQPKIATEGSSEDTEPEKQTGDHSEVDPNAVREEIPFEPELTLKPWLQTEADVTAATTDTTKSADEMITNVLLSMNKGDQDEGSKSDPQPQDQKQEQEKGEEDPCKTPDVGPATIEEKCYMWAIMPTNKASLKQFSNSEARIHKRQ